MIYCLFEFDGKTTNRLIVLGISTTAYTMLFVELSDFKTSLTAK